MGRITNIERAMERWTSTAWSVVRRPKRQKPMEVVAMLRRECDVNAMILGRGRTLVPNHFTIELPSSSHRRLSTSDDELLPQLAAQVRSYAAEQHYHFAGPVTVALHSHSESGPARYRVRSHLTPARAPAPPVDDSTRALPVVSPPTTRTTGRAWPHLRRPAGA
ncbi:DUF3662 domain-containing protein [Streptomyces sp. NPDC054796]